jgi:glycosyltransferase involved in cell wall biosynthesis
MNVNNNPLVSIVMCTYNGTRFLTEQWESIKQQTYSRLEIIITDDCSIDDTWTLLEKISKEDGRVRIFQNAINKGFNENFSAACKMATGDFIAIADQDDIWAENKIELLLQKLLQNKNCVLSYCTSAQFTDGQAHKSKGTAYYLDNDVYPFFLRNYISGHAMLFRRELLVLALPFPKQTYYDWWLAVVACCNGGLCNVPDTLIYHRRHAYNATTINKAEERFYTQILKNLPVLLTAPGLKVAHIATGNKLIALYKQLQENKKQFPLFVFLLKNASRFFRYKKSFSPWISTIKKAYKYSRYTTPTD